MAVKAIRPEQRPQEHARHRFHREARLLSKLEHPNVCRIYDLYEGDPETGDLLILELVEGRKLGDVLKRGLRFEQKVRIAEQIASALEAAHRLRIIHRDLKPSNVMIKGSGRAKVLDFGLARSLDNPADPPSAPSFNGLVGTGEDPDSSPASGLDAHTNHKFMIGTLAFMSPEQAVGEVLTEASDLYSFGLLLQWLFTEVSPYGEEVSAARPAASGLAGRYRTHPNSRFRSDVVDRGPQASESGTPPAGRGVRRAPYKESPANRFAADSVEP